MRGRTPNHLLLALLLSAAVLLPRAILIREAHSETSDDDYHLVRGLEFLKRDPGLVNRELNDPPLGEALAALPLWLMGGSTHARDEGTALHEQKDYLPETALMAVAIWKVLLFLPLIAVVFLWCKRLYGLPSAWLAVALLLVEPTIAGHLHLAALDVLASSGIVIACYFGWRYIETPTTRRLIIAAATCAVALLLKHTGILVPLIFCLYAGLAWARHRKIVGGIAKGAVLTLLFMWLLLGLDMSPVGKVGAMPGGLYIKSVQDAKAHVAYPNDAYLNGKIRRGGWWYYFPVVATYKIPIGIGVILALGLASMLVVRPRFEEWGLLLPLIAYALFLMLQNINIGWRHFLPAYLFMLIAATRVMSAGKCWRIAAWIAVAITAMDVGRWHPDYLAYINWPRRDVYRHINDSNIDWGQGMKQAHRWLEEHHSFTAGRQIYFRASAVSNRGVRYYLGRQVIQLHMGDAAPHSGVLILSPVSLSGLSESYDEYGFLRNVAPHAVIGHALRVYDLDHPGR
jgi:hypothetical protein